MTLDPEMLTSVGTPLRQINRIYSMQDYELKAKNNIDKYQIIQMMTFMTPIPDENGRVVDFPKCLDDKSEVAYVCTGVTIIKWATVDEVSELPYSNRYVTGSSEG